MSRLVRFNKPQGNYKFQICPQQENPLIEKIQIIFKLLMEFKKQKLPERKN